MQIEDKRDIEKAIESILFYKGEEVSLEVLKKILNRENNEIKEAIENLKKYLENNSSLILLENQEKYLLVVNKKYSKLVGDFKKEEEFGELSSSTMETLAIILYKGPIEKIELDQIRGVNSSYILRNLLIKGLIEKQNNNNKIFYLTTLDLMRFLGIDSQKKLPAFKEVLERLDKIKISD